MASSKRVKLSKRTILTFFCRLSSIIINSKRTWHSLFSFSKIVNLEGAQLWMLSSQIGNKHVSTKQKVEKMSKSINNYDRSLQLLFVILSEEQLVPDRLDRWHFLLSLLTALCFTLSCRSSVHSAPFDFIILR